MCHTPKHQSSKRNQGNALIFFGCMQWTAGVGSTSQLHRGKQPIMQDANKCCRKPSSSTSLQMGSKTLWLCTYTHTSAQSRRQWTWQVHECPVHQTRLRYVHHCWCVKYFKWYLEAAVFNCLYQGSNPVARVIASVQELVFSRTSLCEKVELQDKSFHTTSCCQAAD